MSLCSGKEWSHNTQGKIITSKIMIAIMQWWTNPWNGVWTAGENQIHGGNRDGMMDSSYHSRKGAGKVDTSSAALLLYLPLFLSHRTVASTFSVDLSWSPLETSSLYGQVDPDNWTGTVGTSVWLFYTKVWRAGHVKGWVFQYAQWSLHLGS